LNRLRRAMDVPLDTDLRLGTPREVALDAADYETEAIERRIEIVQLRAELDEAVRQSESRAPQHPARGDPARDGGPGDTGGAVPRAIRPDHPAPVEHLPRIEHRVLAQGRGERVAPVLAARGHAARDAAKRRSRTSAARCASSASRSPTCACASRCARSRASQARSRLALAQVKFSHDMASNVDVIEAETELQRAEASVRQRARRSTPVGVYQLRAVAGRLLPARMNRTAIAPHCLLALVAGACALCSHRAPLGRAGYGARGRGELRGPRGDARGARCGALVPGRLDGARRPRKLVYVVDDGTSVKRGRRAGALRCDALRGRRACASPAMCAPRKPSRTSRARASSRESRR
jgi:hypothetical protein